MTRNEAKKDSTYKDFCILCEKDPIPILFTLSLLGCFFIALHYGALSEAITSLMWAFACMAVGTLLGFTFGIPKTPKSYQRKNTKELDTLQQSSFEGGEGLTHQVNTNFEEISDWLTKIIVGVGLIEIRNIGSSLHSLAEELGSALSSGDIRDHVMFAQALIIYFSVLGFLFGYLYTRLKLGPEISEADKSIMDISGKLDKLDRNENIRDKLGIVRAKILEFDSRYKIADHSELSLDDLLRQAERDINYGLMIDKHNAECLKQKAKIFRRKAELAQKRGNDSEFKSELKKAIELLDFSIQNNNRSESRDAYYNRACYKNLSKFPRNEVLCDLKEALNIDHTLKEYARHDSDLSDVNNDEDFESL